jgi:Peptidase propeptide and YPEB domain
MLKLTVLITTLLFSVTGYTQQPDPAVLEMSNALKQKLGAEWVVELNTQGTRIVGAKKEFDLVKRRRISTRLLPWLPLKPKYLEGVALAFLKDNGHFFQIPADMAGLGIGEVEDTGNKARPDYSVAFEQTYEGLPLLNKSRTVVYIDQIEGIYSVQSDYLPNIDMSTTPKLSEDDAINVLIKENHKYPGVIKITIPDKSSKSKPKWHLLTSIERQQAYITEKSQLKLGIYVTDNDTPILAYELKLNLSPDPHRQSVLTSVIDANSGAVVRQSEGVTHYD